MSSFMQVYSGCVIVLVIE